MLIREGTSADIPEIIAVLKASLGESKLPKTEEIWRYKHLQNPFGKSLILIAVRNDKIIGVRAFMRWKWQLGEKVFSAFRAVDTATHPDHQGKGIFKKLTLKAIEIAKENGDHFIFNTPNQQSLPGYLKMKWAIVDKIKVNIYPAFYLNWLGKFTPDYNTGNQLETKELHELCDFSNAEQKSKMGKIFTPKSLNYLHWRYKNNPMQSYEIFEKHGIYIAAYIKQHKYFKELRLAEVIMEKDKRKAANKIIRNWVRKHNANIVSTAAGIDVFSKFKISGAFGPTLTVRNLNLSSEEYVQLLNFESFSYNLGDLELF